MNSPILSQSIVAMAAVAVLLFAAAHDIAFRVIPNAVPVTVMAAGLWLSLARGQSGAAMCIAFSVFSGAWVLWRNGWMGGGDVKLLAASSLLVSPESVPALLLNTALSGGVLALVYLLLSRIPPAAICQRPRGLALRIWRIERRRIRRAASLPYGCAIAMGALTAMGSPFHSG